MNDNAQLVFTAYANTTHIHSTTYMINTPLKTTHTAYNKSRNHPPHPLTKIQIGAHTTLQG